MIERCNVASESSAVGISVGHVYIRTSGCNSDAQMIKTPGELNHICLPQNGITWSGILQASGLRPRWRHQHLWILVPKQAEVCQLQEETHATRLHFWCESHNHNKSVCSCMYNYIYVQMYTQTVQYQHVNRRETSLSWVISAVGSLLSSLPEEHQSSSRTLPLSISCQDLVAHHPRHGDQRWDRQPLHNIFVKAMVGDVHD